MLFVPSDGVINPSSINIHVFVLYILVSGGGKECVSCLALKVCCTIRQWCWGAPTDLCWGKNSWCQSNFHKVLWF